MEVSVILPVYNCEKYLSYTMVSILLQSYPYFELIVIDDGSTDRTIEILNFYSKLDNRIKIIQKEHSGIVDSLNVGLTECKNDLVIRHDAEDFSHRDRFYVLIKEMVKRDHISCCSTLSYTFNENFVITSIFPLKPIWNINLLIDLNKNVIAHPSVIYRKSDVLKVGGYSNEYPYCEDFFLWKKMRQEGMKFHFINIPLYAFMKDRRGITYNFFTDQIKNIMHNDEYKYKRKINKEINKVKMRNKIIYNINEDVDISLNIHSIYLYILRLYNMFLIQRYKKYEEGFNINKIIKIVRSYNIISI